LSTACYDVAMAKPASIQRGGLRKLPTQARSRERVETILKAAGALLGEVGYDGVTTNLIAERAGVPVGSIYQFFETKDDIVAALVERFQERIHKLAGEELDAAYVLRDRHGFIAKLVDGIAAIQAEANAFVCVFSGSQTHARFDGLARELRATLIGHLDRVFAEAFPRLPKAERGRMLAAWSDITGAMIASLDRARSGDRSKPADRAKFLDELKTILSAYLDAKLAASG
jgi:AcrR family transcriptional regulator